MNATQSFQHKNYYHFAASQMGTLAVFIQLSVLFYISYKTSFNWFGTRPISDLGLSSMYALYAVGFTTASICLLVNYRHIKMHFTPSTRFNYTFLAAAICVIITGIIPDKLAVGSAPLAALWPLHWLAASVMFASMPAVIESFSSTEELHPKTRETSALYFRVYIATMLFALLALVTFHRFALSELACLLVFDAWLVYVNTRVLRR